MENQEPANNEEAMARFEEEVMLLINERLYQKKLIPSDLYIKAKDMILRS